MPVPPESTSGDPIEATLAMTREEATKRVLDRIEKYVVMETPSHNEAALTGLSRHIEQELTSIGGRVESFAVPGLGRNLRATFEGAEPALEPVLVLGHLDTVHPIGTLENQPFRIAGERVEGPGVYDMKSGVALVIEALASLVERGLRPRRTTRLILTCDEEIGSHGAVDLFRESADGAFAALVPEPCNEDGSAKTRRKGVGTYRIDVYGKAAHAGIEPEKAVSAIAELADQIRAILALARPAIGTTLNIGTIGGGTASNVVPAHAWATIDTRFVDPAEGERLDAELSALRPERAGARVAVKRTEIRPPLVRTPAVAGLYEQARDLASGLGVEIGEGMSGGGSDGSLIASFGLPALDGLGPRGGGAHAVNEHILLSDLPFRLALYVRLLSRL